MLVPVDGEQERAWEGYIFEHEGDDLFALCRLRVVTGGALFVQDTEYDRAGFEQRLQSGRFRTQLPPNCRLVIFGLAVLRVVDGDFVGTVRDLQGEIADALSALAGRPTSVDTARSTLLQYLYKPDAEALARVRDAYEAVPAPKRRSILGHMDVKDWPIRALLYDAFPERRAEAMERLREWYAGKL